MTEDEYRSLGPDEVGDRALSIGGRCYDLAMSCQDAARHDERIAYFKEAELWYLRSASKMNPWALLCLGYVYAYNRTEAGPDLDAIGEDPDNLEWLKPLSRDEAARQCFWWAVELGAGGEAAYKLGDMVVEGRGGGRDEAYAFELYQRAWEELKDEDPCRWGSAAYRLGSCYEDGIGCEQSFDKAALWFERAEMGLEAAVSAGDWYYKKVLAKARMRAAQARQEVEIRACGL